MIRKSTLLVLLFAILIGGGTYYYETKHSAPATTTTSKPVFSVQAADIQSMSLAHPAKTDVPAVSIERHGSDWQITQPLDTGADSSAADGIADSLAGASSSQTEPGTPDRLKAYGLDPAAVSIEFTLKNGGKHKLLLGNKDFTGEDVYALADSNQQVYLLPNSLLTTTDKTLGDLRDRTVLPIAVYQSSSVDLKNPSGNVVLKKTSTGWNMVSPDAATADTDTVNSLLSFVVDAKMASIASETPTDLAKYGLTNPEITLTVTNDIGKSFTLVVGKKQGDNYFARDDSRPMVFEINADLYNKLAQGASDLLDKTPLQFDESNINEIEIHDSNGTIVADRKSGDDWVMQAPGAQKGQAAISSKVFSVVESLKADEVIANPGAEVLASLAHPAYQLTLTDKSGKKLTLKVSKESGNFVYAQSSESPMVFKLNKQALADLNITPAYLAS